MTAATSKRRNYTEDFKRDAVALVTDQGYKVSEAARSLGIGDGLLRRWRQQCEQEASATDLNVDEREELQRLRKEVRLLRMEKEILKASQYFAKEYEVKYGFIRDHSRRWPVVHLCRLLEVQRSAYYDWRDQPCKVSPLQELAMRRRMKELFVASRASLGSRTMMKNLCQEGFEIGRDRTRRLMKRLNLKVKQKRKYQVTTERIGWIKAVSPETQSN